MTKNEYLIELATRLQALTDDPNSIYPELTSMISFYQEMLDDKIEDGLTEEEAVAAMESPDEIITRLKNEFGEIEPRENEGAPEPRAANAPNAVRAATRREYSADRISLVRVTDCDHPVKLIRGGQVAVNYEDDANGKYDVSLEAGVLTLTFIREKRSFLRNIFGWKPRIREVTVELPDGWSGTADIRTSNASISASVAINKLIARTSNGSISLEDATFAKASGVTNNGSVKLEDVTCGALELTTSNGRIVANDLCCDRARLTTSNASVNVQDAKAGELFLRTGNGGMRLEDVTGEKLHAQTSNASIKISDINAADITLITSNGSVTGSLAGSMEDYAITSRTSNGSNSLPNGTAGERTLDVRTSNGKIAIDFDDKAFFGRK